MEAKRITAGCLLLTTGLLMSVVSSPALAEHLLLKDGDEWLGKKINETSFLTCKGSFMRIGPGDSVRPTGEKCGPLSPGKPDPVVAWFGTPERFDPHAKTVTFLALSGSSLEVKLEPGTFEKAQAQGLGHKTALFGLMVEQKGGKETSLTIVRKAGASDLKSATRSVRELGATGSDLTKVIEVEALAGSTLVIAETAETPPNV